VGRCTVIWFIDGGMGEGEGTKAERKGEEKRKWKSNETADQQTKAGAL
jgi:hypothetical protein